MPSSFAVTGEGIGRASASDIEVNGTPYNDSTLAAAQESAPRTWIVVHFMRPEASERDQELLDRAVLFLGGAIASDGLRWTVAGKTVSDKATFTAPNARSVGMQHVVVNGVPVIRGGELVRGALPGRAIRRAPKN